MSKPLLFLLPHAGGSAAQYVLLFPHLAGRVSLAPLDLPGHGERIAEALLAAIPDMLADVTARMRAALTAAPPATPYALFGHSLGSLLAYLAALELSQEGKPPLHLFVSSGCVPGSHYVPPAFAGLSDEELWRESARHFGGISREALGCPELRDVFVPMLRADLGAVLDYRPPERLPALECPITALHGEEDIVEDRDMDKWRRCCAAEFSRKIFPGGHFYLFQAGRELEDAVAEQLQL